MLDSWTRGNWQDRAALRQGYLDHYAHVRSVVPKDRLLEFKSQDGWEPLCNFLGKDIPDEPYPRINDGKHVVKVHKMVYWWRLVTVLVKMGGMVGAAGIGIAAWWWLRQ